MPCDTGLVPPRRNVTRKQALGIGNAPEAMVHRGDAVQSPKKGGGKKEKGKKAQSAPGGLLFIDYHPTGAGFDPVTPPHTHTHTKPIITIYLSNNSTIMSGTRPIGAAKKYDLSPLFWQRGTNTVERVPFFSFLDEIVPHT